MRNFNDEELYNRVEGLASFKGWKKGIYAIFVRSNADEFDRFDDKGFIVEVEVEGQRPKFVMSLGAVTTNAGSYGLLHFNEYNHDGCAVACTDILVYDAFKQGYHHHIKDEEHWAYVQDKPMPHTRDSNKNKKAENYGAIIWAMIGLNFHHAGTASTVIANWSTACMVVAMRILYNKFKAFMKSKNSPPLSWVVLQEF